MEPAHDYQKSFQEALHSGPHERGGYLYSAPKDFTFSSSTLLSALSSERTRSYLVSISKFLKDKKGYAISYHGHYARLFDSMIRFYEMHEDLYHTLVPRSQGTQGSQGSSDTPTDGPPLSFGSLRFLPTESSGGVNLHQVDCFQEWISDLHTKMCLLNTYITETASYAKITKGMNR